MLDGDDLYADLIADVAGFEEILREKISFTTSQSTREIKRSLFESWVNLQGDEFDTFVKDTLGWSIEGDVVKIPPNKDNEAKPVVMRESVKFERKFSYPSYSSFYIRKTQTNND